MRVRSALALASLGLSIAAVACVSGTTPDCTLVDCGSPAEGGLPMDAAADAGADARGDAADASDAASDAPPDARADGPADAPAG